MVNWPMRPQKIYIELVSSWLRTEVEKLNNVLHQVPVGLWEETNTYHDEYVHETIKSAETAIKQIRKFIAAN